MGEQQPAIPDQGGELLDLYDRALPQVYGYLVGRCGSDAVAEDLTAETFLAAVTAVKRQAVPDLTVAWLVGVARHKLVDHWRRVGREERKLRLVEQQRQVFDDPWDTQLDAVVARDVLGHLGAHHRCALTLRYLDGLSVAETARELDRTVHATETLLVRARAVFRAAYDDLSSGRGGVGEPNRSIDAEGSDDG